MAFGLENALGEITLALFTTLAPAGAIACVVLCAVLLSSKLDEECRQRISLYLWIPILVALVGLVASATHLGNPANALYVLTGVGRSPLSNEIVVAIVAFGLAGSYWLMSFSTKRHPMLQRIWLVAIMCAALAFTASLAFAYNVETIVTWALPTTPVNLMLSAFMAGPLIALVVLIAAERHKPAGVASPSSAVEPLPADMQAKATGMPLSADAQADLLGASAPAPVGVQTELLGASVPAPADAQAELLGASAPAPVGVQADSPDASPRAKGLRDAEMYNIRFGRFLVIVSAAALIASIIGYVAQGALALELSNSTLSVQELVPCYYPCVALYAALATVAVSIDFRAIIRNLRLPLGHALCSAALALVAFFIMRFVFYMMHLTVGISL